MEDEPHFVEKVSDDLMCPICRMLLREPQQTHCGHEFCRECVRPLVRYGKLTCPICRAVSRPCQVFEDKRLKREIMGLKISCDQSGNGCKWIGELSQRKLHNDACGFMANPCVNNCGQVVFRKYMEDHTTNFCPQRIVACQYCRGQTKQSLLKQHYLECGKYPVQCAYKCGMQVTRGDMVKHTSLQGTCPNTPVDCDFHDIGCEFRGKRCELNKHISTKSARHFRLFVAEMRGIKQKLASVQNELSDVQNQLSDVQRELSEESEQRKLAMPTGQFIYMWKIDKWQQKVDSTEEENPPKSNAFYVNPGYHMYISARPCTGDYLSLFLCPTDGNFDSGVDWPFRKSFTLSVVDQQPDGQNISHAASPPFQDGFTDATDSGLGWSEFVTHEELKTRCYIKDDVVLIKLSVEL